MDFDSKHDLFKYPTDANGAVDERWKPIQIDRRIDWSEKVFSLIGMESCDAFLPGQHVDVGAWIDGQWISRPFSLVQGPTEPLQLYVQSVEGGRFSSFLRQCVRGSWVGVKRQARGHLTMGPDQHCRRLMLVGSGTGMAPFFSILKAGVSPPMADEIWLIQGWRWSPQLPYAETLASMRSTYQGRLRHLLCVTFEDSESQYSCERRLEQLPSASFDALYHGRVTDWIQQKEWHQEIPEGWSADLDRWMICGNRNMATDLTLWLHQHAQFKKPRPFQTAGLVVEAYG